MPVQKTSDESHDKSDDNSDDKMNEEAKQTTVDDFVDKSKDFSIFDLFRATWFYLGEYKNKFLFWNFIIFIVFFYPLVPPYIVGKIVDFFVGYTPGDSLTLFYIYCAVIGVLYAVASIVRLTCKKNLANLRIKADYKLKVLGFERLLNFSLVWHDKENSGNKVQRIMAGSMAMRNWSKLFSKDITSILAQFIGIVAIFIFLNYKFLIFFVVYLFSFFAIEYFFNKRISKVTDETNKALEVSSGVYHEGTSNVLSIKTLGAKESLSKNVKGSEKEASEMRIKRLNISIRKWYYFQTLNGLSLAIFLYLTGVGVINGSITVGLIFTFYTYYSQLRKGAENSTFIIEQIIDIKSAVKRMMPIFKDDIKDYFGMDKFPSKWKKITLRKVGFSYTKDESNRKFEIKDLNLEFNKHEKVGVVGVSGGGKSTLVKLLLGLYKLDSGEFKIGSKQYYDIEHKEITDNISIVLQETELFNLSLKNNITLMKDVDKKIFNQAIKIAQLDSIIEKLPKGVDTLIGEKGYRLSGGERQRVGIARAICKGSQILVLDEATSALDSKTENSIQENLEKYFKDNTMIIVAHRLSTLKSVDRIIVFEKGRVIEEGIFGSLKQKEGSRFKQLYDMQNRK